MLVMYSVAEQGGELQSPVQVKTLTQEVLVEMGIELEEEVEIENQPKESIINVTVKGTEWTDRETKVLLDKVEQYLPNVGLGRKFRKKRNMWERISEDLSDTLNAIKTPLQCENRYKTLKKRKSTSGLNNSRARSTIGRKHNEYEEQLMRIHTLDDSVESPVIRGVGAVRHKETASTSCPSSNHSCLSSNDSDRAISSETPLKRHRIDNLQDVLTQAQETLDQSVIISKGAEWTAEETQLLLGQYERYLKKVGPMRRFKKKKAMWERISKDLDEVLKSNKSSTQCENRYKTILKRKKGGVMGSSKRRPKQSGYEKELSRRQAINDALEPEIILRDDVVGSEDTASISGLSTGHKSPEPLNGLTEANRVNNKRGKMSRIETLLLKMHRERESARERRHREKIKLLKALLEK